MKQNYLELGGIARLLAIAITAAEADRQPGLHLLPRPRARWSARSGGKFTGDDRSGRHGLRPPRSSPAPPRAAVRYDEGGPRAILVRLFRIFRHKQVIDSCPQPIFGARADLPHSPIIGEGLALALGRGRASSIAKLPISRALADLRAGRKPGIKRARISAPVSHGSALEYGLKAVDQRASPIVTAGARKKDVRSHHETSRPTRRYS